MVIIPLQGIYRLKLVPVRVVVVRCAAVARTADLVEARLAGRGDRGEAHGGSRVPTAL